MQEQRGAEIEDTGMQRCKDGGHRDAGSWGCRDTGMQGYSDAEIKPTGTQEHKGQGCRDTWSKDTEITDTGMGVEAGMKYHTWYLS